MSDKGMSPTPKKSLRPAIYARVSSKQQAEANTIASQREALQARVQADGLSLEAELCFIDEGFSGGTLLRPALERLRDQAAAGSFDRLYVHSPDRLARHYPYQVLLVEELQRHGIGIVFLNHDIGRTPEENLLLQVQGMMAEYERAKILERSRRGKRHAAQAGVVNVLGGAPYGYRYIGKYESGGKARYEVDEAQAEVVVQIFRWVVLERCSIGEVCRRLRERGIPSPRGKNYWDRTTVWGILQNPAYMGQARFGKTRVGPLRPRRSPRGEFPWLNGTMRRSDVLTPLPPRFVILRLAVPSRASVFVSPASPTPVCRPGALWSGSSTPASSEWRRQDLPSFWGTLVCLCPALRPRRNRHIRPHDASTRPPLMQERRLSAKHALSGLNHTALALAVLRFAPEVTLEGRQTRFPLPASTTGRDWLPAGFLRKVS